MKKRCIFFFAFLIASMLFGQSKPSRFYINPLPKTSIQTNAVLRYSNTFYELIGQDKLKVSIEKAITILDKEGENLSYVVFDYDQHSKINSGKIWIYDSSGDIIETVRLSEMIDNSFSGSSFYSDTRIKFYIPEVSSFPYTVHYVYEKTFTDFFHLPAWVPQIRNDVYVENAEISIQNISPIDFNYYIFNFNDSILHFVNEEPLLKWEISHLPAFNIPEYTYSKNDLMPKIEFPMKRFQMESSIGSLSNWKNFGNWIFRLNNVQERIGPETRALMLSMTDSVYNPKEKAEIVYKWMQKETRYVSIQLGIGGWQPFAPAFVDKNKYGDCKALSYYTKALLNAVGVPSYYTLVQAGSVDKPIDPDQVYNQFNHVILCIPFNGDTTWLECTSNSAPFGYIGDFTDDRYALLIKQDSSKLVKTRKYSPENNLQTRNSIIQVNEEGGYIGELKATYHHIQSEKRWFQKDENLRDQMDNIYQMLDVKGFHINQLKYDFVDQMHPIIYESISFDARQVARMTSSKMLLPLYYLNTKPKKLKNDEDRRFDIVLKRGHTTVDTIIYQIPNQYMVKSLPENVSISSDFGFNIATSWIEDDKIYYVRKEVVFDGRFPADRWEDFIKYKNAVRKADKATAVLEKVMD